VENHIPVLLPELIQALKPEAGKIYVDCTFGRGGHTQLLLESMGDGGRLIAMDRDPQSFSTGREMAAQDARLTFVASRFSEFNDVLDQQDVKGIDGVMMDLGVSSPQLDDAGRGFSFMQDGPLDMRMDPTSGLSAAQWLNTAAEIDIANVIYQFGEERYSRRIAREIVAKRTQHPLTTTADLVNVVLAASPKKEKHKHPATRTFQAVRIHVNNELGELRTALTDIAARLNKGGRLAVISFHSLEDRIVKRFFREMCRGDDLPAGLPVTADMLNVTMKLVGKPIKASETELQQNPRARSAVLRIAEKIV
jgi:16S rRNA (cytosine1402-N4)-methyltransferase